MIEISQSDVRAVESMLSDIQNGATKAMVTAINKTVVTTKVQVKKKLGQKLNLTAKRINKNLSVKKANYDSIQGAVVSTGKPIGLINFKATQLKKGVKAQVLKSSSRQLIEHAFIATSKGAKNVWWRKKLPSGKLVGRLPIERLTGPRIEDIMGEDGFLRAANEDASELLVNNLSIKVDEILRRHHG